MFGLAHFAASVLLVHACAVILCIHKVICDITSNEILMFHEFLQNYNGGYGLSDHAYMAI